MYAVNQKRHWKPEHDTVLKLLVNDNPDTLKNTLGRTKHGLRRRLTVLALPKMTMAGRKNGMSSRDFGIALGLPHFRIVDFVNSGYLHGEKVQVWKRQVYSFSVNDAIEFLQQHAGLFQFKPTRRWNPVVDEAQRYFHEKYISQKEITARYGLTSRQVRTRKQKQGFPQPTADFRQSSSTGIWYNRVAIEHWIAENA